jgi:hypothetical protein
MGLFRRRKLPAAARPALDRDERVVAWAATATATAGADAAVVATNLGVWLPSHPGRIGWHEIHKASWSGRQLTLVNAREIENLEGYAVLVDEPGGSHTLAEPDNVPNQVRVRVNKSIAYSQHHPEPGVRVVARRVPGVDGLRWTVRYDDGIDPADPAVRSSTAELVEYGKASLVPQ